MTWIPEQWGVRAVINAGMATRDHLRAAIQTLSLSVKRRYVFAHTGWRYVNGGWAYLTATGPIGRNDYEVDLGADLVRYTLPATPDDAISAMHESVKLLGGGIAPMTVMAPLWGAVYRAPTAAMLPVDVTVWI